jgi:hypothetical protein
MQALLLVAEHNGPTMFARIGFMRALNRHVERVFNSDRKDQHGDAGSSRGIDDVRQQVNVRFCSHNGLKSDIPPCPLCANKRHNERGCQLRRPYSPGLVRF